jgi:hypothetical protein
VIQVHRLREVLALVRFEAHAALLDNQWDYLAECHIERLSPLVPGAQGVIYDTALRCIHHQTLLRNLGLLPLNRVTAKKKGSKKPRRAEGRRIEKSAHVEHKKVSLSDGRKRVVSGSMTELSLCIMHQANECGARGLPFPHSEIRRVYLLHWAVCRSSTSPDLSQDRKWEVEEKLKYVEDRKLDQYQNGRQGDDGKSENRQEEHLPTVP